MIVASSRCLPFACEILCSQQLDCDFSVTDSQYIVCMLTDMLVVKDRERNRFRGDSDTPGKADTTKVETQPPIIEQEQQQRQNPSIMIGRIDRMQDALGDIRRELLLLRFETTNALNAAHVPSRTSRMLEATLTRAGNPRSSIHSTAS